MERHEVAGRAVCVVCAFLVEQRCKGMEWEVQIENLK